MKNAKTITERIFQDQVRTLALMNGWQFFHPSPGQVRPGVWRSDGKGYPDITLAHESRGLIFAELKLDNGKASPEQLIWLKALAPYAEVYIWRPADIDDIAQRLGRAK
jgi:hypothetical protein